MRPESRKYLWDASRAVERICRFVAGKTIQIYQNDDLLRSAVERQFEIIGESLSKLRAIDPETAGAVPDSARIIAFRNLLIHGYATIDDMIVWGVVEGNLPELRDALRRLLSDG